ncbi:hypothetical protein NWP13_10275 [Rhodococcus pyridinivorans]|nr:hypothetical protein [Rhodococcus pyridinivorans]
MKPSDGTGSGSQRLRVVAAVVLPPIAAVLVLVAYHHAAGLAAPDQLQFALYWTGFLSGMLPLVVLACSSRTGDVTRTCALAGIGLFGMVPRLLRTPVGPMGSDEFVHLRQTIEAFLNGDVGHSSYLSQITKEFTGLHQVVNAFARLTGVPVWHAGMAVIVLAHVLSILAVYQLVRAVGASAHGAATGAVVYTLNPSWVYFDVVVAYESLALPMLLWFLAATVAASRAPGRPHLRYFVSIALCAMALPFIHHLTTIILCLILVSLIVASVVHRARRRMTRECAAPREYLWPLLLASSIVVVSVVYWWSGKYGWLISYLSPALTRGWEQLSQLLGLHDRAPTGSSSAREIFGGTQNPVYEIVSGLLFPVVVLVLFLASLSVLWCNRRGLGSAPWAFAWLGAMYFASMPMVLTKGGAEGAHRSWAFSFIGIAVVCGLARSFGWPGRLSGAHDGWPSVTRAYDRCVALFHLPGVRAGVVAVVFSIMAFGNAALGANVSDRFPGSPHVGDDARSISREGEAVAAWMATHTPVDTPVLADRFVSLQVGSVGRMASLRPSATFPIWDLYMSPAPVSQAVLKQVLDAKIRYFVVDARMATTRPRMGYWFTRDEPGVDGPDVFPRTAIDRFNCLPWLQARYAAGPLTVYEVDVDTLLGTMAGNCDGRRR